MDATPLDRFLAMLKASDHQAGDHRLEDAWRSLLAQLRAARTDVLQAENHLRHAGAILAENIVDI